MIRRGEVYWLVLPGDRGAAPIAHPWVVVQDDVFNHARVPTTIVCALTTNLGRATEPGNVLLDAGEADLPQPSVVVVSQVETVEKSALTERVGMLAPARVEQILDGLRFQQRAFFARE